MESSPRYFIEVLGLYVEVTEKELAEYEAKFVSESPKDPTP